VESFENNLRVYWLDPSRLKSLQDSLLFEGGDLSRLEQREEVAFGD
jgi:hypothetical protein